MIQAQIKKVNPAARQAVVATEDGRELTLTFPENANIEVYEPATTGTMGGTLEDLREGYWVEVEIHEHAQGPCTCTSLICVS